MNAEKSPQKTLVYAPLAILGHHFETDLELAEKHLRNGDEVSFVTCDGELKSLNFYACKGLLRCQACKSRQKQGLASLRQTSTINHIPLGKLKTSRQFKPNELSTIENVNKINHTGVEIGSAYVSSLIAETRNPNPTKEIKSSLTKIALTTMAALTERLREILNAVNPDVVYFFNGRFSLYRPLLRLCQQSRILCYAHERGASNAQYSLAKNTMPHDIAQHNRDMDELWGRPTSTLEEKRQKSDEWYRARAGGASANWISFVNSQSSGTLPEKWQESKVNIAIYVSSEDEFVGLDGWEQTVFPSQADAIHYLCQEFSNDDNFRFYIRFHPNLKGTKNKSMQKLMSINYANAELILPESKVSTYALMQAANKVISFGSTTGIEAVYWGTPSLLVGKSFYMGLNAVYEIETPEQLVAMIKDLDLPAGSKEGALKYGYWASSYGEPFEFYEPINLTVGKFKGEVISGHRFFQIANYVGVLFLDLSKVLRGHTSFWHVMVKIKLKLKALIS